MDDVVPGIPDQAPELVLEESTHGLRMVLHLRGELDFAGAVGVADRLERLARSGSLDIVVDLGGLTFVDASGLSALVTGARAVETHGGVLALRGVPPQVERLLGITGLSEFFTIEPGAAA